MEPYPPNERKEVAEYIYYNLRENTLKRNDRQITILSIVSALLLAAVLWYMFCILLPNTQGASGILVVKPVNNMKLNPPEVVSTRK